MPPSAERVAWNRWLRRWDAQQARFNPERETRFRAMLDTLEAELGPRFHVLDLGSGPGSLAARIVHRFPSARVTAVDHDPVVLQIGARALGSMRGRLVWVDAKLGAPGWTKALARRTYDGAVSSTALHWLSSPELSRLYVDLARLLRRGGVFVNADHLPWSARDRPLAALGAKILKIHAASRAPNPRPITWRRWWREARRVPALRTAFAEHDRRFDRRLGRRPPRADVSVDLHVRKLRAAGFRTVATVWQDFESRVLFARR